MITSLREVDLTLDDIDLIHATHQVMTILNREADNARSIRNDAIQSMIRQYGFASAYAQLMKKYGPIEGLSKSNMKRIQGPKDNA